MKPKVGVWSSPGGLDMRVVSFDKKEVHVEIDRVVRSREGERKVEVRKRVVPMSLWETFSQAYSYNKEQQ